MRKNCDNCAWFQRRRNSGLVECREFRIEKGFITERQFIRPAPEGACGDYRRKEPEPTLKSMLKDTKKDKEWRRSIDIFFKGKRS